MKIQISLPETCLIDNFAFLRGIYFYVNRDKSNEGKYTSEIMLTLCTHELILCTHVCIPSESQKESLMIAGIVMFLGLIQPMKPNPRVPVRGNKLLERV